MKKQDYLNLLENGGTLNINQYCFLSRFTKNALGRKVDILRIHFSITHYCDYLADIISRDVTGIKREIEEHQMKAFIKAAETLNKEMMNGAN